MGSELCITVTSSLRRAPLHEGMRSAVARYAEAASQFSMLQAAVSLAASPLSAMCPLMFPRWVLLER
jgi:hypothetical protein